MLCLTCAFVCGTRLPTPTLAVSSLGLGEIVEADVRWKEIALSCTKVFNVATHIVTVIAHLNECSLPLGTIRWIAQRTRSGNSAQTAHAKGALQTPELELCDDWVLRELRVAKGV